MQELQKTISDDRLASITIKNQFVQQLYHVNYLVAYPISDLMLEGWTISILELAPKITLSDLKEIMDRMKLGSIPYDHRKGVQNIFIGYAVLLKELLTEINKERNKIMEERNQEVRILNIKNNDIERSNVVELLKKLGAWTIIPQSGLL